MVETPKPAPRLVKVAKFQIIKPVAPLTWDELGRLLRQTRYRVFRLANLIVSEAYLNFHLLFRSGKTTEFTTESVGKLNHRLRDLLKEEPKPDGLQDRFSATGALPNTIAGALSQYKTRAVTQKAKWSEVIRGNASLPTFRNNMAIPVRCDKEGQRRLQKQESGDVTLELMICRSPYPKVILQSQKLGDGQQAVLDRLLANVNQSMEGYRQRAYEIKEDENHRWFLYVTYDMPMPTSPPLNKDVVVGVDLGVSCPLYVAVNNDPDRLGRREFTALSARIKSLQSQVIARRISIQRGARSRLAAGARLGHGRKRALLPIETLQKRIEHAYTTLNHQLSKSVVEFALKHGAGVIQLEDLTGLQEALRGTFLGARWRYHQLQQFIEYKAKEHGITVQKVNPRYTSRRCSKCGHIHVEFDRAFRDKNARNGAVARFVCPACSFDCDPDYNAARNLSILDIANIITRQYQVQNIALSQHDHSAAVNTADSPVGKSVEAAK